jgi:hypothetical protein
MAVSLELDQSLDLANARPVRLAGHEFQVAPLSLRQILAIADYVPKLSGIGIETMSGERLAPLAEVLWHGLRRAHPRLTREEFFDLPITIAELVAALPVRDRTGRRQEGGCRHEGSRLGGSGGGERFDAIDWRALVAELVIELHWTRDEVLDQVDMTFLEDLHRAWTDCPPTRRMVAAYLGFGRRPKPSKDYRALLAMFPNGTIR